MFLIAKHRRVFIFLFGAIFFVSIAHSLFYRIRPSVDAGAYDNIGWNVARGNGYIEDIQNINSPARDNAIARVGPGYQFFLAGVYSFFGHTIWVVWILQALLHAATAYVVYKITRMFFTDESEGHLAGIIAAVFVGFSPDLIILSSMLLTETLALFLLSVGVWCFLLYVQKKDMYMVIATSASLALATLVRSTFILLVFMMMGVLIYSRKWKQLLIFSGISILIFTPWTVRNYNLYGKFIPTTAVGGYDLWVGNNPDATGGFVKTPEIQQARDQYHVVELEEIGVKKYFEFLSSSPLKFIKLQIDKTAIYFSLFRPTGFWTYLHKRPATQSIVLASSALWTALLLILGTAGAFLFFFTHKTLQARLMLVMAILQPISVIPIIVESRYRTPFLPFLAFFAVFYIVRFFSMNRASKKTWLTYLSIIFIIFIGITGYDIFSHWAEFAGRAHTLHLL